MKAVVLFALVVACAVATSALKCHKCLDTATTKECEDNLADKTPVDCDDAAAKNRCYKFGKSGAREHGCAAAESETAFCEPAAGKLEDCSTCTADGCNSSSSVLASAVLIAVSAALLKMYN